MPSWMNSETSYEIDRRKFPSFINHVPVEIYGEQKAHIDVKVTQMRFFKGTPDWGWPHQYAINGEAIVNGITVVVCCLCTDHEYNTFIEDQSGMVFELMAGETIPEAWTL